MEEDLFRYNQEEWFVQCIIIQRKFILHLLELEHFKEINFNIN